MREEASLWACSRGSASASDLEPLELRVRQRRQERERELSQQRSDAAKAEASQPAASAIGSAQLCSAHDALAGRQCNSAVRPAPEPLTVSSVQIDALRQELAAAERTVEELKRMLAQAEGAEGRS